MSGNSKAFVELAAINSRHMFGKRFANRICAKDLCGGILLLSELFVVHFTDDRDKYESFAKIYFFSLNQSFFAKRRAIHK